MTEYIVYHGTNSNNVESIRSEGFRSSSSLSEWLGCGVYFFIEGAFGPITNAREWGINTAWDKKLQKNKYTHYSILKTTVSGEKVLDLRIENDLKIFSEIRDCIFAKYEAEKSNFRIEMHPDTFLCNAVSKSMNLDILIHTLYIKTKYQRINRIQSRVPNSVVLCAKQSAIINLLNIKEIEKNRCHDE